MLKLFKNELSANVVVLALLSVLEALQALILVAFVLSFIPIHPSDWVKKLFEFYHSSVRPEREMPLYRFAIAVAIGLQAFLVWVFRRRLEETALRRSLYPYMALSVLFLAVQLTAVFKFFVFGQSHWTMVLLGASIGAGLLSKIFWQELRGLGAKAWAWLGQARLPVPGWVWDAAFCAVFLLLLCPADMNSVAARMFGYDRFYHLDSILMAPGWAHLNGLVLNLQVTSEYSTALPVLVSEFLKHTVGFDYGPAATFVVAVGLCYYAGLYAFTAYWLKSRLVGALAVLMAVRWQMFHWGVMPLVWLYPSATPLRHWPDLLFLYFVWRYLTASRPAWFWAASATAGFTFAWMLDVGVYMMAALLAGGFLEWMAQAQGRRSVGVLLGRLGGALLIAAATAFIVLGLAQPGAVFQAAYWRNALEFAGLFVQGWGALPMTDGLKDKQFLAFVMGFAIPMFYTFTLAYAGAQCLRRKAGASSIFTAVVCVYGLGLYHYFIHRSAVTSYYAVSVPLVLVACGWLKMALDTLPQARRRIASLALVGVAAGSLGTMYLFTFYPNLLNLAGVDWKQEREVYRQRFDMSADAGLVRRLTKAGEPAAVISSFETRILMQADRPPFFYYTPLMESAHMQAAEVRGTYLHTYERLQRTIDQLKQHQPEYIFVEKKLLAPSSQQALTALLGYVGAHYRQVDEGQFLAAMRREK